MPVDPDNLPSDIATLQAMLAAQAVEIATRNSELAAARVGLLEQRYEIEALRARLARALRVAFGRSSEKLRHHVEQLELTLADLDEVLAETEPRMRRQRRSRPTRSSPRAVRSRKHCGATSSSIPDPATLRERASNAAGHCANSARTSPSCSTTCRVRSGPFGMSVLSCPAAPARPSRKHRHPACRSVGAGLVPVCWCTCWWPNTATIFRCIGRPRSMRARISTSAARRWRTWWAKALDCCGRSSTRSGGT